MKANEVSLVDFLTYNKAQFIIPIYQRDYDWSNEHCSKLFNDIKSVGTTPSTLHFIGSMVYVQGGQNTSQDLKDFSIIDGQQRLTTITLIYIAIYQLAIELGLDSLVDEIYETHLVNKFTKDGIKIKLQQTGDNLKALSYLVRNDKNEDFPEFSRVINNFNYFKSVINKDNLELVRSGLSRLMIVEISLDRTTDNAQAIFESLNSTGLDLSESDLVRNYILMGLNKVDQERIYYDYWQVIERLAKIEAKNESRVSDFIRDYLTLTNERIPNKRNVYDDFKRSFPPCNTAQLEVYLAPIKSLARSYNKLLNPKNELDLDIRRHLEYIGILDVKITYPLLMKVYEDYLNSIITKAIFLNILNFIESYMCRRTVVDMHTTGLNKVFMAIYNKVDKDDYLRSLQTQILKLTGVHRMPKDKEVLTALKTKDVYRLKGKRSLYILSRLEDFNNSEFVEVINNPSLTIEHIFPQTPSEEWSASMSADDYSEIQDSLLSTLGNLTLSGNNGSLGNLGFLKKRDLPEKGYAASRLWLNRDISQLEYWDVSHLKRRLDKLSARFLEVWYYPDIEITASKSESEFVNIFEIKSLTHKKIEGAIFLDDSRAYNSAGEMYLDVVKRLFEINPERIFATNISSKLNIERKNEPQKTLRHPHSINDSYSIELNLPNSSKLSNLQYALDLFDMHDALYLKIS